ncbi:unnamed protein product [Notodromas monacha]|uniref:Uncharacterized protein n=1 Tax=Notodromas monacha TaxID=399045 RepID=A0A7R9BFU1_9CRUS|nr:unnamed protein product [Notodromas monacha]CAG0914669.1 unnamed protein product [Notodromas monacha]
MVTKTVAALAACGALLIYLSWLCYVRSCLPPVILIPGDGGNQIEGKLDKSRVVHFFCLKQTTGYVNLWFNLNLLLPFVIDCWVDNMRLIYDNVTRTTSDSPGVTTRVPGFGSTAGMEFLDPLHTFPSRYFVNIAEKLTESGYERGSNLLGAPYDFRKAPNELEEFFQKFRQLVEDAFQASNGCKVVLVAHSYGGPLMLYFFSTVSQEWKNTYVGALISLSAAWAGCVKPIKAVAAGDNLNIFFLDEFSIRKEQRSSPSIHFLFPSPHFWGKNEILVSRPSKNYSSADYAAFYADIGDLDGYEMYKDVKDLIDPRIPPGVEVHCLYGVGVDTWERIFYDDDASFPDEPSALVNGDGDGTVNLRSLQACKFWEGKQKHSIYALPLRGIDHLEILRNEFVLSYVAKVAKRFRSNLLRF